MNWNTPPRIEEVGGVIVVRDDLLPGGTKRRALTPLMAGWPEREFVFGGPAQGHAQLAMAWSSVDTGKTATYFVAERHRLHPLTAEAQRVGAHIVQVPHGRLNVVQRRARDYCTQTGARFLPLGFDLPEFLDHTADAALSIGFQPREVWCAAGAGLLTRALQAAWPHAHHHAVQVGFPPSVGDAMLHRAVESFDQPAEQPPPFPSAAHYDAKVWRFVRQRPGALFWNVARD